MGTGRYLLEKVNEWLKLRANRTICLSLPRPLPPPTISCLRYRSGSSVPTISSTSISDRSRRYCHHARACFYSLRGVTLTVLSFFFLTSSIVVGLASAARLQPPLAAAGAASSSMVGGGGGVGAVVVVKGSSSGRERILFLSRRLGYHAGEGRGREGGREGGIARIMAGFVGGRGSGGMLHAQTTRLMHQRQAGTRWPAIGVPPFLSLILPRPPCPSSLLRARSRSLSFSSLAYEGGRGGEGKGGDGGLPRNDAPIIRTRNFLTPLHAATSSASSPSSSSPPSSASASAVTSKPQWTKQQQQQQQQQQSLSSTSYMEKREGEGEDEVYGLRDTYSHSPTEDVGRGVVPGGGEGHLSPPYELLPEERVEGVTVVRDVKGARRAVEALYAHKDTFFAVDTEVADLNLKTEGPVGNGRVICFSIYGGPEVDFGHGKGT
ncbi:hypothetical protein VYU27_009076, partial [Nannochloropsis oceanica]